MEIVHSEKDENKKTIHPIRIFKEGLGYWKTNFLGLGSIYLIVYLPVVILQSLFLEKNCNLGAQPGSALKRIVIFSLGWLIGSYGYVALTMAVKKILNGAGCKIIENIKDARKRFWSYLGVAGFYTLLLLPIALAGALGAALSAAAFGQINKISAAVSAAIAVAALVIICVIFFVYFCIRLSLGCISSVIEEKGPIAALRRSHYLVKNYVNPVVGEYCLCALIFLPLLFLPVITKDARQATFWLEGYSCLIGAITVPLAMSILVVLYNKLKEAVDV